MKYLAFFYGTSVAGARTGDKGGGMQQIVCAALLWLGAFAFIGAPISQADPLSRASVNSAWLEHRAGFGEMVALSRAIFSSSQVKSLMRNPSFQLAFHSVLSTPEIKTIRFQTHYRGIEVIGAQAAYHKGSSGGQLQLSTREFDIETLPTLTQEEALSLVRAWSQDREPSGDALLRILPSEDPEVSETRLTYWVTVEASTSLEAADFVIDAHSGEWIAEIPQVLTIAPVDVFSAEKVLSRHINPVSGAPIELPMEQLVQVGENGVLIPDADDSALHAIYNAEETLKYFKHQHGRDSYDNRGGKLITVVHVGRNWPNAFWNSERKMMAYGDGDGVEMTNMTLALDVAGHEMTHGVVSETANLLGFGESGALNEAYADFFGKMIEAKDDWLMGRVIYLNQDGTKGIRNLKNPESLQASYTDEQGRDVSKPYPSNLNDKWIARGTCRAGLNDMCWVHVNSTIASHAAYRVLQTIGKEKTEKLYYTVLTHYLTARTGIRNSFEVTIAACQLIYDTRTCDAVKKTFVDLGL